MYAQVAVKPNLLLRNGAYGIVMRGVQKCTRRVFIVTIVQICKSYIVSFIGRQPSRAVDQAIYLSMCLIFSIRCMKNVDTRREISLL